jgi:hypothetical protein
MHFTLLLSRYSLLHTLSLLPTPATHSYTPCPYCPFQLLPPIHFTLLPSRYSLLHTLSLLPTPATHTCAPCPCYPLLQLTPTHLVPVAPSCYSLLCTLSLLPSRYSLLHTLSLLPSCYSPHFPSCFPFACFLLRLLTSSLLRPAPIIVMIRLLLQTLLIVLY